MSDHQPQTTLAQAFCLHGVGLHSGRRAVVHVTPAPVDHGLRIAKGAGSSIRATAWTVTDTRLGTTLGVGAAAVQTVEHWLAALTGLGIDNAHIRIDGPEFPILDGSARLVVDAIRRSGRRRQPAARRWAVVTKAVAVQGTGEAWARLEPYFGRRLEGDYLFRPPIGRQRAKVEFTEEAFLTRLAPARTFGFAEDVERLRRSGRARGGDLSNAVVFDGTGPLNPGGLRAPNEVALHKLLDAWGDLSLLGMPWRGRYIGHRSGHALNVALVMRALSEEDALRVEPCGD